MSKTKVLVVFYGAKGHLAKGASKPALVKAAGVGGFKKRWSSHWLLATKSFSSCGAGRQALAKLKTQLKKAGLPASSARLHRADPGKSGMNFGPRITKCPR